MQNGDGDGFHITEERTIPDVYADSVRFHMTAYGVTLEFGQTMKPPTMASGAPPHVPKIRISMSPQHAKVMALLLVRGMRQYEDRVEGKLPLPAELIKEFDLQEEW